MSNYLTSMLLWMTYLKLKKLSLSRTLNKLSFEFKACTNFACRNIFKVWHWTVNYNLQCCCSTAIRQLNKRKVFSTHACSSGPSSNLDYMVYILFELFVKSMDANALAIGKCGHWLLFNRRVTFKLKLDFTLISTVLRPNSCLCLLNLLSFLSFTIWCSINCGFTLAFHFCPWCKMW